MDYFYNAAVIVGFAVLMFARVIITAPVQIFKELGKHSLLALITVDVILLVLLVWLLWATDWSFWGHW